MPTLRFALAAVGDLLSNLLYGFHEVDAPTNEELTTERRKSIHATCQKFLVDLVGPGDLLDSQVRHEIAQEAYAAFGSPINMHTVTVPDESSFFEYNQKEIQHKFVTTGPFREVTLAIVNFQKFLDEEFFEQVVQHIQTVYKEHSMEDCRAMAVEITIVAAGCDAVRTFYAAAGIDEYPPLPPKANPEEPARFESVSDYALSPLKQDATASWGPFMTYRQIRPDVFQRFNLHPIWWKYASIRSAPLCNYTAAPLTAQSVMNFFEEMYVPLFYLALFLRVPGPGRHLVRAQLEPAIVAYSAGKRCRF
ncbi:expressed unknown protein [Seminavis robusta]|uniref:Uncharacterized protein n=1 Tax=Seminavis robusta TaxID=568900 RepID=A0A9N8HKP6_9STRA|nr:expressed unknown protein [Seminavis robusta]|eukprot:Sro962_g225130.1 n/a (306) ;mRNA; f:24138-25055